MSQPNPQPDYNPITKRETVRLSPVADVPSGGLGGTVSDPAQEIGNMIHQLQARAQAAQERVAAVERERDDLQAQLEEVSARLMKASSHEAETRERFVEVTSVIRERDELLESVDMFQKSIAELQRRIDTMQKQELDLQRQRGALILERDRALQDRTTLQNERDDARSKLAEAQKQAVSLRQARDAAQAQCHDLTNKNAQLADELHELSHDLKEARSGGTEAAKLRTERDEAIAERSNLADRLAEITRELETQQQRVLELTEQQSALAQADTDHAAALAQTREEALILAQERDELRAELERMRSEPAPASSASPEREAALEQQLAAAQSSRDEVFASLQAAQKQIEHIIRDRDQVRQQGIDRTLDLERDLQQAVAKAAEAERRILAVQRERDQTIEKAENFDQQRLAAIDVAAQLDAAKREIKKLTADLAEARLEAKASQARGLGTKLPPPLPKPNAIPPTGGLQPSAKPTQAVELDDEVLTEKEAKGLLAEIKRCHTTFAKSPTDFSLLNELHCQLQHLAERARVSGFLGLHRISHAFSLLAQDLYRFPEQVNPSTLRTINQTIELIGTLLKQKNYAALKDPARAHVFAVDDDAENCDSIRMAMESISMRTRTAQEPAVALAEISADNYDLIFLDVALPHMDGFELCQHIRSLPNHAHTPVVFLTGLTTIENRVQSSLSGGNEFIGKPFNLHELSLKAISLVLKASLHME